MPALGAQAPEGLEIEEVVVTGTYIKGTPIDSPFAATVTDRDGFEAQGALAMVDFLKNLGPNNGAIGEVTSWLNGTGQAVPESVANVNLRGLGASRTLVLFNGRRQTYVPSRLVGGRFVDVNALPSIALRRIEVLKEGAAAVYGSDAVAGVVNFLTRDDFDGFEASASWEHFDGAGDGDFGAIWGRELGVGHAVLAVEHARRKELNITERPWALPADGGAYWGWSGVGNPGAFIVPHPDADEAIAGPLSNKIANRPRFVDPNCANFGGEDWGSTCSFRFGPWDNFVEEQRQTRVFAELNGELGEAAGFHLEALWSEATIPGWLTTPSYPPVARFDDMQQVAADHPGRVAFVKAYPSLPTDAAGEVDLRGDEDWYFFGRLIGNSGPGRSVRRDSETLRLAGSVAGELGIGGGLDYDVGVSWSRSEGLYNRPAQYSYRRFLAFRGFGGPDCGVGVVADPSTPSGLVLGPVPAGVAPGQGNCQYYNPFSNALAHSAQPGAAFETVANPAHDAALANDPALFDWLSEEARLRSTSELLVVDAVIGGTLIEGALDYAAGYQFRHFDAASTPNDPSNLDLNPCWIPGVTDCADQTGLFGSVRGARPYQADQSTHAVFVEFAIHPFERWDAQLALHYEEHDQSSSFDPKLAMRLSLTDELALRGSLQTTFRTPSVDDLNLDIRTNLELLHSVGTFKAIETTGSADLDPESAFTYNLGLIYLAPSGIEVTLDYWSYHFRDPIVTLPFSAIEALYGDPATRTLIQDLIFCPGNLNDGSCEPAIIERVRVHHINGPDTRTQGFDLHVGGVHALGDGELSWGADLTHVTKYDVGPLAFRGLELTPALDAAGYLNDPVDGAVPPVPQWKARASVGYRTGPVGLFGYLNGVSGYKDRARHAGTAYADIDAFVTVDATLIWQVRRTGLTVSLSVFNLFDEDPPLIASDHFFDGMTHNPKGRRIKLGLRYRLGGH